MRSWSGSCAPRSGRVGCAPERSCLRAAYSPTSSKCRVASWSRRIHSSLPRATSWLGPETGPGSPMGLHSSPWRRVRLRVAERRIRYDLRTGLPDVSLFPRRQWQSAMASVLREMPDAGLLYGSRRGLRQLRVALSDYLGRARAVVSDPGRVFICAGAAHGMGVLWNTLAQRGAKRVAVEDPAWRAIPETVVHAGLEVGSNQRRRGRLGRRQARAASGRMRSPCRPRTNIRRAQFWRRSGAPS